MVPALPAEMEFILFILFIVLADFAAGCEVGSKLHEPFDLFGTGFDDSAHIDGVAEMISGGQRIGDMFIERVAFVENAGDASLRQTRIADFRFPLADDADASGRFLRQHQSSGKTGDSATDNQVVIRDGFISHFRILTV